jgi:peptidoglycan/xylan/chitin deacetylase (PgdA/CDA1 family)
MIGDHGAERLKKYLERILVVLLIACWGPTASGQTIPILVYHRFDSVLPGPTTVHTAVFDSQLAWLEQHHYRVLPLHAAIDVLHSHLEIREPAVAITVDDGHRSVYTEMFPLILKHRIPVTLFIYPSAISNAPYALTWQQIRKMQESGLVEVQSHTYWHPNFRKERARLAAAQYDAFVKVQLERSRQTLESRLGIKVDALAWPFGIYDLQLEAEARQAGYQAAFAYEGGPARAGCDEFAIPRIPVSDHDTGLRFGQLLGYQ